MAHHLAEIHFDSGQLISKKLSITLLPHIFEPVVNFYSIQTDLKLSTLLNNAAAALTKKTTFAVGL